MEWRGRLFAVLAYSEDEARKWWGGISESERRELLGTDAAECEDGPVLFD